MEGNDERKNKDDNKEERLSVNSPRPDGKEVDHQMEAAPRRPLPFLSQVDHQMGDAPGGPSSCMMALWVKNLMQMEYGSLQLSLKGTCSDKKIIKSESEYYFSAVNQSREQLGLPGGRFSIDLINSEIVSLGTAHTHHRCCMTCKRQFYCSRPFPGSESFCPCHRKLTPIIGGPKSPVKSSPVRARWNPFGEGTSTIHNYFASDFASEDDVEIGLGHTLRRPTLMGTMPNVSDETRPSQASDPPPTVPSDSPPTVKNFTQQWVVNVPSNDGDIQTGDTPTSVRGQGGPPPVLQGDSSFQGVGHEDSNIQPQGGHSSDRVPSEQRLGDYCLYHHALEDNWQRLTTMVDPFLAVNVQGACSLVAYKKSDPSSPAKDVLFYLLVTVYVLGFLSAFASKWFRCYKMGVIGLVATVLGFLMTLALVVIYKIG